MGYIVNQRPIAIGIRRVMGTPVAQMEELLSSELTLLVMPALVIAISLDCKL